MALELCPSSGNERIIIISKGRTRVEYESWAALRSPTQSHILTSTHSLRPSVHCTKIRDGRESPDEPRNSSRRDVVDCKT